MALGVLDSPSAMPHTGRAMESRDRERDMNSVKINGTTIVRDEQWNITRIFIERSDRSVYGFEVDRMSSSMSANRARSTALDVEVMIADDGEVVVTPEVYRGLVLGTIAEDVERNARLARRVHIEGIGHKKYTVSCSYCGAHRVKCATANEAFLAMATIESLHRAEMRDVELDRIRADERFQATQRVDRTQRIGRALRMSNEMLG